MKVLALLFLTFTLPGAPKAPLPQPVETRPVQEARKGGVWYFADTGHAVYCYGPVMYITDPQGAPLHVATFCQGEKLIVPLKE
ncbi:MAG TPA: hypothetical protein VLV49_14890 [Terriglobales bacterium]|nr:hypothetical protein [Terriglobales bacterium]